MDSEQQYHTLKAPFIKYIVISLSSILDFVLIVKHFLLVFCHLSKSLSKS